MRAFANFVSYALHPIFLFTYLYILYWVLFPYPITLNLMGILLITGLLFINTAILPVLFLLFGKRSLVKQTLQERRSTVLVVMIIYSLTFWFFPERFLPDYLRWTLIAIALGMLVAFVVNFWFKISLHASGWGGFVAVFLYLLADFGSDYFYPFMLSVICAGLVGMSRLFLGAHTNKELYFGYISGFVLTASVLFIAPIL
ncbi:MAG: hypothetical protein JXQ87_19355 [Bacteroidia bacterium]